MPIESMQFLTRRCIPHFASSIIATSYKAKSKINLEREVYFLILNLKIKLSV